MTSSSLHQELPACRIGCPVWACPDWVGSLYSSAHRRHWLREYSNVFPTVEGNSTFYALPPLDTVQRWLEGTAADFRIALKFPRRISHELQLRDASEETAAFLKILEVIAAADRLGPSFLQLPPWFSPGQFTDLARYLVRLPEGLPFAVEVRHPEFFGQTESAAELNSFLETHGMDRVIFDSRGLFSAPAADESERRSRVRKPRLPVEPLATAKHPFVRIVGRNATAENQCWIDDWVPTIRTWIRQGKSPYVFTHSPNDRFAPAFARRFHESLCEYDPTIGSPAAHWPGERMKRQQKLF